MTDIRFVSRWLLVPTLLLTLGLFVGGCSGGGDDDDDSTTAPAGTEPPATPTPYLFFGEVKFVGLEDGDVILLTLADPQDTGKWVATYVVDFDVTDFELAPEGECGNEYSCGRLQLLIDGEQSGDDITRGTTAVADFSDIPDAEGQHTLTLKLIFDDGSDTGVSASVDVLVQAPTPGVTIVSPNALSNLDYPADGLIDVVYTVSTYKVSDDCGGMLNCGGHRFWVTSQDDPQTVLNDYTYDVVGTPGDSGEYTIQFNLDEAGSPTGALVLHAAPIDNEGNVYTDLLGNPVEALSTFNVKEPDAPAIVIDSPASGDTVTYGNDGLKTVTIHYTLQNFTPSFDCGSQSHCGEIWAVIANGSDPSQPDAIYNNRTDDPNSIDVYLYYLDYHEASSTGLITVTLQLMHNDGTPVEAGSRPVSATVAFNAEPDPDSPNPSIVITSPRSQQTVSLNSDKELDVLFTYDTDTFTLAEPGNCGDVEACGYVEAYIDDDDAVGNANAVAYSSPITVSFAGFSDTELYDENGHRIMVRLVYSDGTPVTINGIPVADWVTVIIREPQQPGGGQR